MDTIWTQIHKTMIWKTPELFRQIKHYKVIHFKYGTVFATIENK
jgi:hypothetical protein